MNMQMLVNIVLLCILFDNEIIYVHSFGAEHIPEEIEMLMENNNIKTNTFRKKRKQFNNVWIFFIGFIDFMFACKTLIEYTGGLFSLYNFKENDKAILFILKNE